MTEVFYKKSRLIIFSILVVGIIFYSIYLVFIKSNVIETTNNAYVRADFTRIAPKISGFIDQVLVEDNQVVKAGQVIVHIDDHDYQVALQAAQADLSIAKAQLQEAKAQLEEQQAIIKQAEAVVNSAQAEHSFAKRELIRHQHLAKQGAGSVQNAQQAESQIKVAYANLLKAQAALIATKNQIAVLEAKKAAAKGHIKQAEANVAKVALQLSYTNIVSPIDGIVGHRTVRIGNYVTPGTQLMAIVPIHDIYIVANFQETQLAHVTPKQTVSISVDTFGQTIYGKVESIAPATGLTFADIAPDNATGNFTKVVQRIPVKIVLDNNQPLVKLLRVGMSVEASIDTSDYKEVK